MDKSVVAVGNYMGHRLELLKLQAPYLNEDKFNNMCMVETAEMLKRFNSITIPAESAQTWAKLIVASKMNDASKAELLQAISHRSIDAMTHSAEPVAAPNDSIESMAEPASCASVAVEAQHINLAPGSKQHCCHFENYLPQWAWNQLLEHGLSVHPKTVLVATIMGELRMFHIQEGELPYMAAMACLTVNSTEYVGEKGRLIVDDLKQQIKSIYKKTGKTTKMQLPGTYPITPLQLQHTLSFTPAHINMVNLWHPW